MRINQIVESQTAPEAMTISCPNSIRESYPKMIKYKRKKSFNTCELDEQNLKDYLKQRQSGQKDKFICVRSTFTKQQQSAMSVISTAQKNLAKF